MSAALWLLAFLGTVGAFDTLYYHEWRARLPARTPVTSGELRLHAACDFLYAILFGTLPWLAWHGAWTLVLGGVIAAEIALTFADFVEEASARKELGDVFPGERVTHAVMAITYGALLASLLPELWTWVGAPSGLAWSPAPVAPGLRVALTLMAAGVFASGVRDVYAASGGCGGAWPWARARLPRAR